MGQRIFAGSLIGEPQRWAIGLSCLVCRYSAPCVGAAFRRLALQFTIQRRSRSRRTYFRVLLWLTRSVYYLFWILVPSNSFVKESSSQFRTRHLSSSKMRHLWHIPRYINVQNSRFSVSSPHLRPPFSDPWPRSPSRSDGVSKAVTKSRRLPTKSDQRSQQPASGWREACVTTAARWKSGWQAWYSEKFSHRLATYGVLVCVSGMAIIYIFAFERVPITGRKRFSWLSQSMMTKLEEAERESMEKLRENEEKSFIKSDYAGLRKIEAVFNRLVKASGLEDVAWEVRVIDEPCRSSPRGRP